MLYVNQNPLGSFGQQSLTEYRRNTGGIIMNPTKSKKKLQTAVTISLLVDSASLSNTLDKSQSIMP